MNKIKILIIDDDLQSSNSLKKHLIHKDEISVVECVHCVKYAEEFLKTIKFDVILLDIIMPEYDGFYFLEHCLSHTPIIVISNCSQEKIIKKAFDLGSKYYVIKPYDCEIIYNRIHDVLYYEEDVKKGLFYKNEYTAK